MNAAQSDSPPRPARKTGRLLLLAALAAGGIAAWHASLPAPLGPAEGTTLDGNTAPEESRGTSRPEKTTFRIGTFNIHGCTGEDGRRDVDRVAECLGGLDFVALNEVHGPMFWQRLDQAGELGRRLGLAWLFAPDTRTWHHVDFGNGLLSAMRVEFWQRIPLQHLTDRGYRNAVLVGLRHGGRTIRVLLTHVTRHDDPSRHAQLRTVFDLFLALREPAILLGDMNSEAEDPQIRALLAEPGVTDSLGRVLGPKTPARVDWIFVRGLRTIDAGFIDNGASDHPMVWAELTVEGR